MQQSGLVELRTLVKLIARYTTTSTHQSSRFCASARWLDEYRIWGETAARLLDRMTLLASLVSANPTEMLYGKQEPNGSRQSDEFELANQLTSDCVNIAKLTRLVDRLPGVLHDILAKANRPDLSALIADLGVCPVERKIATSDDLDPSLLRTIPSARRDNEELENTHDYRVNSASLTIWRRTRDRLMGYDPICYKASGVDDVARDSNTNRLDGSQTSTTSQHHARRSGLSVEAQVDACIAEAVDTTNLARMYEGWTAWEHRAQTRLDAAVQQPVLFSVDQPGQLILKSLLLSPSMSLRLLLLQNLQLLLLLPILLLLHPLPGGPIGRSATYVSRALCAPSCRRSGSECF
ncbi:unnamed protein product [Protopolystoma xenopodis]|uniref:FATC domain-containing protein n=1 Tax=Protopolystoma xenopodis TaxID=117903 RepID=A0A448WJE9_9PLAT|nr:unnamed protein product [Protopolystoma xenopodis]